MPDPPTLMCPDTAHVCPGWTQVFLVINTIPTGEKGGRLKLNDGVDAGRLQPHLLQCLQ